MFVKKRQYLIAKQDIDLEYPDDVTIPAGSVGKIVDVDLRSDLKKVKLGIYFESLDLDTVYFSHESVFEKFEIEDKYESYLEEW